MATRRIRTRLLFDENLPWRVASALQALQFEVTYVGDESASPPSPGRGSTDEEVLKQASTVNQVIVSSNWDMVLLCIEANQSVVWVDPHGKYFQREELAVLDLKGIRDWSHRLEDSEGKICVRVLRSRTDSLNLDDAKAMLTRRMNRSGTRRTAATSPRPLGPLAETWDDTE
ncbi:MAG: DUF5615 family PIN-like protein [Acidimicrobiaceae bacterium]|nr:DUF5615 family PIN-like protein [Acidimicrobiaceae bacterium]MDE0497814.1 DUF5615 family PIN-like protein [Acidimicrobiaceae bacterium]